MRTREIWVCAALALTAALPGFSAPMLKATVSHMCCGGCESAVKTNTGTVAWAASTETNRNGGTVTVAAKDGSTVDAMALFTALHAGGFPPTRFELSGAGSIKMDVGHLCCGGCVGPLKTALAQVSWVKSADVQANRPVTLTIDPAATVNLSELMSAMMKAGYSPKSMVVAG
jgi:copper chaperone CopZ